MPMTAPVSQEQQRSDGIGAVPDLAETGPRLLTQLLCVGQPQDGRARDSVSLGLVEAV